MRSVVSEGASLEQAIEVALQELQVGRERVDIEVLEGAGERPARIRATLRPVTSDVSPETSPASAEPGELARHVLGETLVMLGLSCEVASRTGDEPGATILDVTGPDRASVIGRDGELIDALEYVLNRIAFLDAYGTGRITVDADGYRERREQALRTLARDLAGEVRESGRSVRMDPMSARDRRIVHLSLRDDASVETVSEGEGRFRRLVIVPRRGGPRRTEG